MTTLESFLPKLTAQLKKQEYLLENAPIIGGIRGLVYARSPGPYSLILTKVVDHFFFVDWENALFGRKEYLSDLYQTFNRLVNAQFKVPNVLRLTIPSMAVIAVSKSGFDSSTINYAENTYEVPFKGGEVGQYVLVDLAAKEVFFHRGHVFKQPGEGPLRSAQGVLVPVLEDCLRDDFVVP